MSRLVLINGGDIKMRKPDPERRLIDEVEELCKVYVGRKAPTERWALTCERFERIDKLVKQIRRNDRRAARA